ncbi:MAG: Mini-ribonuclease 3 [Candidatus Sericytochromatia bacterium]
MEAEQPKPTDWARLPVRSLAYIGDAVYELHVREGMLKDLSKVDNLHRATVARVSATGQAAMVQRLLPHLREDELAVFKRARNHKTSTPRRVSGHDYRLSTAFEAVLGYTHLRQDWDRLRELLDLTDQFLEEEPHAD